MVVFLRVVDTFLVLVILLALVVGDLVVLVLVASFFTANLVFLGLFVLVVLVLDFWVFLRILARRVLMLY